MRKIVLALAASGAVSGLAAGAALVWRRNPRMGTAFVNSVVNPALIRRDLAGKGRSEIGTLEHIGRRSGVRRLTPVHPEPTRDGFRIIVPLGSQSEWARNVMAAGHCRLQLHDLVYELDEPRMIPPGEIEDIPSIVRRAEGFLAFQYLLLRRFASGPGSLEPAGAVVPEPDRPTAGEAFVPEESTELAATAR